MGAALRRERLARGWNQQELANRASLTQASVSKLERGEGGQFGTFMAMVAALGLMERLHTLFPDRMPDPRADRKAPARQRARRTVRRPAAPQSPSVPGAGLTDSVPLVDLVTTDTQQLTKLLRSDDGDLRKLRGLSATQELKEALGGTQELRKMLSTKQELKDALVVTQEMKEVLSVKQELKETLSDTQKRKKLLVEDISAKKEIEEAARKRQQSTESRDAIVAKLSGAREVAERVREMVKKTPKRTWKWGDE